MGIAILTFFGDKTTEELEKEVVKIEKKMEKLDNDRVKLKVAIEMRKHESSTENEN